MDDIRAIPTSFSRQRLVNISCFIIWLGYFAAHFALLWWIEIPWNVALNDSFISASFLAAACLVIAGALNYYLPRKERYIYIVIWTLVLSALSIAAARWTIQFFIEPTTHIDVVDMTLPFRFVVTALLIGWVATVNILWNIQQDHKENEQLKVDAERLAREAELYNLRQQLQPHFLFNSLNSIIALIGRKPEEARKMTFQLSDFLRGTLRKDDQQLMPLADELAHLKLYLEIEKVRFGHRLSTHLECDDACLPYLLPSLIMQPLVENAIKYGLYDTAGEVTISITCTEKDGLLTVQIENPYNSQSDGGRRGTGFGLRGVQRRLFLLYGRTDLLETHAGKSMFRAVLRIPQR